MNTCITCGGKFASAYALDCFCGTCASASEPRYLAGSSSEQRDCSPSPLPECLDDIYSRRGGWEEYSQAIGYRKAPCDIRTRAGEESGPYWPNAGKFVPLDCNGTETLEREVVAVCYYVPAEEKENKQISD